MPEDPSRRARALPPQLSPGGGLDGGRRGPFRIGIHTGGTFTDVVALDETTGESREAAVQAATATALGTAWMVARRGETPEQLTLFTGLRPLDDQAVRRLTAEAIRAALTRMEDVQQKITGRSP